MSKFWVITKQVYKRRVKTKSFLISLLFPVFIAALIAGIPKMVEYFDSSSDITTIAVLTDNPIYQKALAKDKDNFKVMPKSLIKQPLSQLLKMVRLMVL